MTDHCILLEITRSVVRAAGDFILGSEQTIRLRSGDQSKSSLGRSRTACGVLAAPMEMRRLTGDQVMPIIQASPCVSCEWRGIDSFVATGINRTVSRPAAFTE